MKKIRHIGSPALLLLLLLAAATAARAQYSVRINTITIPPINPYFDQLFGAAIGGHFQVMITGSGTFTSAHPPLRLVGTLECLSPTPFTITLNPDYHPTAPIPVAGPTPAILTPAELAQAFGDFIPNNLVAQGTSLNNLLNAGSGLHLVLPEGTYRLCFTAYAYDVLTNQRPLSDPNSGCTTFTLCYRASAPQFVLPVNTMAIPTGIPVINPAYPVQFNWTTPNSTCGALITPLTYTLEIHQLFPGQTPTDALKNPPVFTKGGLPSPIFPFDTLLYPNILQLGKQYAIRVQAGANPLAAVSSVVFANSGYSTVGAFQYGGNATQPVAGTASTQPVAGTTTTQPVAGTATPQPIAPAVQPLNTSPVCVTPPSNTTPLAAGGSPSGIPVTVAGFTLNIDPSVRADSGGTWTGTGNIVWSPFGHPIGIAVSFSRLAINTDRQVFGGTVSANANTQALNGLPLNQWTNFTQLSPAALDNLAATLSSYIQNNPATQMIHQVSGSAPVSLPLGLDQQDLGGQQVTLDIVSMNFTPQGGTMNAMLGIPIPEMSGTLTLAGVNICLSPSGVSGSSGTLLLPVDRPFNMGGMSVTLKGSGGVVPDSANGTYVSWAGGQLQQIVAHMNMTLPPALVPEQPNGTPGTAPLTAQAILQFYSWSDWIAGITMPVFEVAGAPNIGFSTSTIWYDHSLTRNPGGFAYPVNYPSGDQQAGGGFEGLFIPSMNILLPSFFKTFGNNQRVSFGAQALMMDENGVTVDIQGQHIIGLSNGNLGGWAFSLDSIGISVVENTFNSGGFGGKMLLPASSTPLQYNADLQVGNGSLQYSFVLAPAGNLSFDIWKATVTLGSGSQIQVANTNGSTAISATLNGSIGFNIDTGSTTINFNGIQFTGLGFNNNGGTVQFTPGTWSLASSETLAGFSISISTPKPATPRTTNNGLQLGIDFPDITVTLGDQNVVSASAGLSILGQINFNNGAAPTPSPNVSVRVDSCSISGEVGTLWVQGSLSFYSNDPVYGNGAKGSVGAGITGLFSIQAWAQFGNFNGMVPTPVNYSYWYVDACANIPVVPIAPSPFGISGFGGGFAHNMSMQYSALPQGNFNGAANNNLSNAGSSPSGVTYKPQKGSETFAAQLSMGTVGTTAIMNATLALQGSMHDGNLSDLLLSGWVYAFSSGSSSIVSGQMNINLSFGPNGQVTLDANADVGENGNWPPWPNFNVPVALHTGPDGWFFKLGDPVDTTKRAYFQLINDRNAVASLSLMLSAYFAVGSDPPLSSWLLNPDRSGVVLEDGASNAVSMASMHDGNPADRSDLAFLFGADVSIHFNFAFAMIYADVNGGAGFDVALFHSLNGTTSCNSTGWNGWYANGDVYAWVQLDVGIAVDAWFAHGNFQLVTLWASVDLKGGGPNPTWGSAQASINGSILNGWVSFHGTASFSVGPEACYPNIPSQLDNLQIVGSSGPTGTNISTFAIPFFTTNIALGQSYSLELPPSASNPNGAWVTYKIDLGAVSLTGGNQNVPITTQLQDYYENVQLNHTNELLPNTSYTVTVLFNLYQWYPQSNSWGPPGLTPGTGGAPPQVPYTFSFTTGAAPATIVNSNVHLSYPVNGQRYVLRAEFPAGIVQLDQWQPEIMQPVRSTAGPSTYQLYFIDMFGGDTVKSTFVPDAGNRSLDFVIPRTLNSSTLYRAEFWVMNPPQRGILQQPGAQSSVTNNVLYSGSHTDTLQFRTQVQYQLVTFAPTGNEIYTLYFGTSRYDHLADKINAWGSWSATRNGDSITIVNSGGGPAEDFDEIEMNGFTAPDGTPYLPLFHAGIDWNTSLQNDQQADQTYSLLFQMNMYQFYMQYGGGPTVRSDGLPTGALDLSGWNVALPLTPAEMLPVGQTNPHASMTTTTGAGTIGHLLASGSAWQSSAALAGLTQQTSGPRTFRLSGNASLNTTAGLIFSVPATTGHQTHKTGGGGRPVAPPHWPPHPLVWSRDYYIRQDVQCARMAGSNAIAYVNLLRSSYQLTPAEQQSYLSSLGNSPLWFGLDAIDGMSIPADMFYGLYTNFVGYVNLTKMSNLTFQPYPSGVSRPINFSYALQDGQIFDMNNVIYQGSTTTTNFTVK